jgi:tetratricopeptide (TPR) repeat protein
MSLSKISELDSAIFYFDKHLKTEIAPKASNSKAFTYFNLAGAYKLKQDYVKALENYNKAETIYKDLKSHDSLVKTYVTIAEFFRFKYDFVSAEKYLNLAKDAIDKYDVSDVNAA